MKDIFQYYKKQEPATLQDLQEEIKQKKAQIEEIKSFTQNIDVRISNLEHKKEVITSETNDDLETFVHNMTIVQKQRWYTKITLKINPDYQSTFIALLTHSIFKLYTGRINSYCIFCKNFSKTFNG